MRPLKYISLFSGIEAATVAWKPFGWIDRPPGVNRIIGYVWLAHLLYPNYFRFDMVKVVKEYFSKFYHYNLSDAEAAEILNPQPVIK